MFTEQCDHPDHLDLHHVDMAIVLTAARTTVGVVASTVVVSCVDPMGNVSSMLFPEGRSSELGLRRGVGQAAHTLNNPQVECTGVLLCVIRE